MTFNEEKVQPNTVDMVALLRGSQGTISSRMQIGREIRKPPMSQSKRQLTKTLLKILPEMPIILFMERRGAIDLEFARMPDMREFRMNPVSSNKPGIRMRALLNKKHTKDK